MENSEFTPICQVLSQYPRVHCNFFLMQICNSVCVYDSEKLRSYKILHICVFSAPFNVIHLLALLAPPHSSLPNILSKSGMEGRRKKPSMWDHPIYHFWLQLFPAISLGLFWLWDSQLRWLTQKWECMNSHDWNSTVGFSYSWIQVHKWWCQGSFSFAWLCVVFTLKESHSRSLSLTPLRMGRQLQ